MIAIRVDDDISRAEELGARFDLPLENSLQIAPDILLGWQEDKLALFPTGSGPVFVDFVTGKLAHRRQYGGGKKQALTRAIGLSSKNIPNVIDATAGLGRDSFVLASMGCEVKMIERSQVIAGLLEDALDRARQDHDVAAIAERLSIICIDAIDYLSDAKTDVVYLDPMYPERRKSAAVKKEMYALQMLLGPDQDSHKLLEVALQKAKHRVVVKRPRRAETLSGQLPNSVISSPKTRYDIYSIKAF